MNEAAVQIGNEQLIMGRIEDDVAKPRAAVGRAVVLQIGEQRHRARLAIDLPHRAGPAAGAELAVHEGRSGLSVLHRLERAGSIRRDDMQAIGRCRRHIDIRRPGVVQRHSEDLTDGAGRNLQLHGRVVKLRLGRAMAFQVKDFQRRAVRVDHRLAAIVHRAGKPAHRGIAGGHHAAGVLRQRHGAGSGQRSEDHGENEPQKSRRASTPAALATAVSGSGATPP